MPTPFVPSNWHLQQQIARAMAACDADVEQARLATAARAEEATKDALDERFERACAFNRRVARERHEANLVQMPRRSGYKVPT